MPASRTLLVTGATGLVGRDVVTRLLARHRSLHVVALVRDPARWVAAAHARRWPVDRVSMVAGDVTLAGLGLAAETRASLARRVDAVLHCAADTCFSRPLDESRLANTAGTAHLLDVVAGWTRPVRFAHVSTAYVAGRRTGLVPEDAADDRHGWVNAYEQSKAEAEALVRASPLDWVVIRPSTIVCDDAGEVVQPNAVHRGLRVYHGGLAAMLPGGPGATLDVVTSDYVAEGVARIALAPQAGARTFHLCAGDGAIPLDEMLALTWDVWARDPDWRRRAVARPAVADLATWDAFTAAVEETGSTRLAGVLRSLAHFVPQLALPKRFATAGADAILGARAPRVADFWPRMLAHLASDGWRGTRDVVSERAA